MPFMRYVLDVFLGVYEFAGDPKELLAAYDRMMSGMPSDDVIFHACVERSEGITIYDCCPSAEVFAAFSSSDAFRHAIASAGLPEPTITAVGDVHRARTHDLIITG